MNLADIAIIASIIATLVSIPFLSMSISRSNIGIGTSLGMDETLVNISPKRGSRAWGSSKFESTFQTAFGEFRVSIEPGKIEQELIEPDKRVLVVETPYETIWTIYTQDWILNISRTPERIIDSFSSPEGELKVIKEKGGISDYFEGVDEEKVRESYLMAKEMLQEEVEKMEEAKSKIKLPTAVCDPSNIDITKMHPKNNEWVKIENPNDCSIDLTNWTLSDIANNTFTFPEFVLESDAWVKVHSGYEDETYCSETETDLCWQTRDVWNNVGDTAILRDSEGNLVDTCSYTEGDIVDGIVSCG